jgi:hypothetical protein
MRLDDGDEDSEERDVESGEAGTGVTSTVRSGIDCGVVGGSVRGDEDVEEGTFVG